MIKIRTKSYTAEFSHPGRGVGTGYTDTIINHNLNADIVNTHVIYENAPGEWWLLEDFDRQFISGSRYFGYFIFFNTLATATARIYYVKSSAVNVRITLDT